MDLLDRWLAGLLLALDFEVDDGLDDGLDAGASIVEQTSLGGDGAATDLGPHADPDLRLQGIAVLLLRRTDEALLLLLDHVARQDGSQHGMPLEPLAVLGDLQFLG